MNWSELCAKSIQVGHRKVDVAHDGQDWHDENVLTCRWRLTDHDEEVRERIAARHRKLDGRTRARRVLADGEHSCKYAVGRQSDEVG